MIPATWDNVTIDQYVAIKKTEAIVPKDKLEEHDLRVQRACILTGLDLDVINAWSFIELLKVDTLLSTAPPTKVVRHFRLNGNYYTFRENPKKYSGGEYSAVMNACKDGGLNNLHRLCYLISQPTNLLGFKKKVTDPEDIEKRIEDFKQLPLKIANPMAVFFWTLSENLTDVILDYSAKKMTKITAAVQKEISYLEGTDG